MSNPILLVPWLEKHIRRSPMNKERKTKTTIARPSEKSTARWEMTDEEIWGMEASRVALLNKPSERKIKTTIARPSEKSTARWEMTDEEIWGMEASRVALLNKPYGQE
jgi:hypothetical protein